MYICTDNLFNVISESMGKGNLFTGMLAGVALTLAGRYLLDNTETGREIKQKMKEEVDKLRNELNSKKESEQTELNNPTEESSC